ncbi:Sec-independent protein translocase TatB [Nitrosospira sp. Nsp18]|jgi:sec-independent protein translocase protein TatB|uniref:Sec-independent protein translocase protein TatB n=1 Tax=Nitrosospira sp. Nsp18 TaxID=1855334 RepID=UPI00088C20BA|nr:Sec-independent protein translocase protein TatB [Nitrosospira sp. Nsp18]SDA24220.1 Sec-independent protein translocase TatB [Nitrosospira sp. Nsp18]
MFDISFTEILVIAVVGLVVIGPERLPKVARTLGHLFGRAQRYANDVKNDIQREMELEELKKWKASVEGAARSIEDSVQKEMTQFQDVMETEAEPKPKPSTTASASSPKATEEDTPASFPSPTPVSTATPSVKAESSHDAAGPEVHRE